MLGPSAPSPEEPEPLPGLCNPWAAPVLQAGHSQSTLKLFSNPGHSVIPGTDRTLPRARIKLWHTWKIQAFTQVNLSRHLETPEPLQGADGLREPQDRVDIIHCYANTEMLLKLVFTLLAGLVSKHPKGRQQ